MSDPEHISKPIADVMERLKAILEHKRNRTAAGDTMPIAIQVGDRKFATKTAAIAHFREILKREFGNDLAGDDLKDVLALIERHPESEQKIGCGIKSIRVVMNPEFTSQRCFWIERTDGTETDFSYLTCIDGKSCSVEKEFLKACRYSVVEQIISYKQRVFMAEPVAECALTGVMITWECSHIDHVIPFADLVTQFLKDTGVVPTRQMMTASKDGQIVVRFACKDTEAKWQRYHDQNAILRAVHPEANLKRKRKAPAGE